MTETITWRRTAEDLPDTDLVVLIHCPDAGEPCWVGYRDDDCWRLSAGSRIDEAPTHWAELPEGPQV